MSKVKLVVHECYAGKRKTEEVFAAVFLANDNLLGHGIFGFHGFFLLHNRRKYRIMKQRERVILGLAMAACERRSRAKMAAI